MENIHEVEDTGDKEDVDESDQVPVRARNSSASFCSICDGGIVVRRPRSTPGVYSDQAMLPNRENHLDCASYYRLILFHREKHICRFSGISQIVDGDYDFLTRQAPWDEHTAIIRSSKSPCLKNALATALMYENRHLSGIERLTCLMVHARCWQLLCKHRIWSLCRGDIKFVMRALYRADLHREHQPLISLEDPFVRLRDDTDQDPFYSNRVQSIIRQAGRRTRTQYQDLQYRHKMVYLSRLPPEILLLIANLLPSTDAAAVQKAVGSYLGDTYWRSRIPDMFYEVQDLSTESLNWEYLCLGLERLKSSWDIYYPCRKEAWDTLDAIVQFIGDDFNNA